jgi:DNA-binding NtrC family response regulator
MSRTFSLLLVDDHTDTLSVLAKLLRTAGYTVQTAASCRDALNAARYEQFDLAICDIGLPDGSGNDLMRQLTEKHGLKGIAVTAWSASCGVVDVEAAVFQSVLLKPFDFQKVLEAIEKALTASAPESSERAIPSPDHAM